MKTTRLLGLLLSAAFLLAGCGTSSSSPSTTTTSQPPVTAVIKVTNGVTSNSQTNTLQGVVGNEMDLDGSGSKAEGTTITAYHWSVSARPAGSTAQPAAPDAMDTHFTPDVDGNYTMQLQVTDAAGTIGIQRLPVIITRHPVTLSVNIGIVFNPTPTKITQDVQVGSAITLDASNSSAAGGKPVTISWNLASKPVGSLASLPATGPTASFTADVAGEFDVKITATDGTGGRATAEYVFLANPGPSAVVIADITSANGLSGSIQAATNYLVMLNGSASTAAPGDSVNYLWTLVSKPTGSTASLSALTGVSTNFIPDIVGDYLVTLTYSDTTAGLSSTFTMTIHAAQGPVAIISASASPIAIATVPAFVSSTGAKVTLLGDGSYELDGDPLTYAWSLTSKPSGSTASITNPTSADASITPDLNGTYGIKLTVTDTVSGAAAVSTATLQVGAYLPVVVVAQPQVSVLLGGTVTDSASSSYDPQGLPLTFDWSILSAPAGSSAAINGSTATAAVSFTPDTAGTYTLAVAVSNGTLTSNGLLTVTAFSASAGTIPLAYEPLMEKYIRATNKLVLVSSNPNALHTVDLNAATDTAVPLPGAVVDFSLSPDGTRAAVLHSGAVSVIDLVHGTLLNTWPTNGAQTMVLISNTGLIYLSGQVGGQWLSPAMTVLNAGTGATVQSYTQNGDFYGTMRGILVDQDNEIITAWTGLSPQQMFSVGLNSGTGQITGTTGSPYWGTYAMTPPFWLSQDETLVFTTSGTYFNTNGLTYVGTLGLTSPALSIDDDGAAGETVALAGTAGSQFGVYNYPAAYQLYSGSPLFPQGSVPLPLVAGVQSYGLAMFHSSTGQHVMVVQTGSNQPNAAAVQYFALLR